MVSSLRVLVLLSMAAAFFAPKITTAGAPKLLRKAGNSSLFTVAATGYERPFLVADVHGTHKEIGFALGALMANEAQETFDLLIGALLGNKTIDKVLLKAFLNWQWSTYLEKTTPQDYLDELEGVEEGGASVGVHNLAMYYKWGIVLSSYAVGDVGFDIEEVLVEECKRTHFSALCPHGPDAVKQLVAVAKSLEQRLRTGCSIFGAWGSRTQDGDLWTGRNLDWMANTGMSRNKLITIYHPTEQHAHATIGWPGLLGAITGMSSAGITVHEAGDDNKEETSDGVPWTLRVRQVMERTADLKTMRALWKDSDNTLGINHGFGSAVDKRFVVAECKANYTAFFNDNDPREADMEVDGKHYGFPLEDALWRTNHAYDPEFLKTARDTKPGSDSENRYVLLHDMFAAYKAEGQMIGELQAVNITAVPGDKGGSSRESFLSCSHAAKGSNIISATYFPEVSAQVMYIAFEEGLDAAHIPACCGHYVKFDMSAWF